MMTQDEKGTLPLRTEKLFYDLQNRIYADIVRRIKKTGEITSTADYQINKLLLLGNSTEFIEKELKELLNASYPEIWALYDKVCDWEYVRNKDAYEQINGNFIPLEENETVRKWADAISKQTQGEIKNLTRSMGFTVQMRGKKVFTPLATYYQKYLDSACMDIITGSFDYNTVLRRVVKEMTASGLQTVDYASGWRNRAPVAARRAIMTGVSQLSSKINEMVAKDLKTDKYEVTWHGGHRPEHWWGGKVYSYDDLVRVCELGEGRGLCGWNCKHSYYAFVDGFSARTYTDEQLEELEAKEQEEHEYKGKSYNAYQASQAQRQMETTMRAQRANIKNLKQGNADLDTVIAAQARYLNTLSQYKDFSKKMKLPEQMERVYMDGLGRMAGRRTVQIAPRRYKDNEKNFTTFDGRSPQKGRDIIKPHNIMKEMNKSEIGRELLAYIQENDIPVNIYYGVDVEPGRAGTFESGTINVYADNVKKVKDAALTVIHEATHAKINKPNTKNQELECFLNECRHRGEKLTKETIKDTMKYIDDMYPYLKWE